MKPLTKHWPKVWIVSDARNDAALGRALKMLPRGSGLIFRHYHLPLAKRRTRFAALKRLAHARGHLIAWSGSVAEARRLGADAAYGSSTALQNGSALPRLVTVHSLHELARAQRADAVLLSPVFATRSHPGANTLGPLRFRLIAARAQVPVIALGGMNAKAAQRLDWQMWAAIDAFCGKATPRNPLDS
ncbi:thiamine phosphate synthase [Novosphingobium aquiterrae]|uniref:Thiamine phosphate synthase n=1 Tax=Novosphingobium aquiterrae TaxID=624388 RepID=A0ABV6PJS1_9SPHN